MCRKKTLLIAAVTALLILVNPVLRNEEITAQWTWQNPLPQGNRLEVVHAFDNTSAIAIGYRGTIITATNGGESLDYYTYEDGIDFFDVFFTDEQTGWAVGPANLIIKTEDGGRSWTKHQSPVSESLYSVHFVDGQTGWAVGNEGTIIKTENGGNEWQIQTSWTEERIWTVFGINRDIAWAAYPGGLLKTEDGGGIWVIAKHDTLNLFSHSVFFTDEHTGWVIGKTGGRILKAVDGGNTWQIYYARTNAYLTAIHFCKAETGWITGDRVIFKTTDGGITWTGQTGAEKTLFSIAFSDVYHGWAVGMGGLILRTEDGGASWRELSHGKKSHLRSICFCDEYNGWAAGIQTILHTDNGGKDWIQQEYDMLSTANEVSFIDNTTGWIAGVDNESNGLIIHTDDGGETWNPQFSGDESQYLRFVQFVDASTGYAGGNYGTLLKTTDGGKNWTDIETGFSGHIGDCYFTDADSGWICGGEGAILRTEDGGETWTKNVVQYDDTFWIPFLRSIQFVDKLNGWCCDFEELAAFYKTNNGGKSWIRVEFFHNYSLTIVGMSSFFFLDRMNGWAGSWLGGGIFRSSDGGETWELDARLTDWGAYDIFFLDSRTGWFVDGSGAILKYAGTGIGSDDPQEPPQNMLFQNYPNPCNDRTVIRYYLPAAQAIRIDIYDILGRLVETLLDDYLPEGYHSFTWTPHNIASGVYFCRLQAVSGTEVIKMVMVK